jgi:lipoyl(octanoyl) transferase
MDQLHVRYLGRQPYEPVFEAMQAFTDTRDTDAADELWVVEHEPVFTQGLNGKSEHLLDTGDIPVVQVDRGGQVTYHGPGQIVIYLLVNVRRKAVGVRAMVTAMEHSIINLLSGFGITSEARPDAPGVYVKDAKVAALGLRIRRGCSYHGLSLNHDMDLLPFQRINPCGYQGLEVTQLKDLGIASSWQEIAWALCGNLVEELKYSSLSGQQLPEPEAIPSYPGTN